MFEILFMIVRLSLVLVLCHLLALPQAWRNGLVGDSIPALITELCLLLIQLELSLLMIAAELITLINLVNGYFEFNTQTQFILVNFRLGNGIWNLLILGAEGNQAFPAAASFIGQSPGNCHHDPAAKEVLDVFNGKVMPVASLFKSVVQSICQVSARV